MISSIYESPGACGSRAFVHSYAYGLGYAEQEPIRIKASFDQPCKLLEEWRVINVLPRLVQILVIRDPILHRDDDGRKPCPHKFQIHDEPGGSAVSVPEGMNDDQISMHPCRSLHRMKALSLSTVPVEEALHALADVEVVRRDWATGYKGSRHRSEYSGLRTVGVDMVPVLRDDIVDLFNRKSCP